MKLQTNNRRRFANALSASSALALFAVLGAQPSNVNASPTPSRGIVGTGTLVIVGTGSPASTQTNTRGIVGTGTLGIVGTGSPASTQTNTRGIVGTGTLGIVGTGSPASTQTNTRGIVGTGTLGIVGTGVLGIMQTGASGNDPVSAFEEWSSAATGGQDIRLIAYGPVDEVSENSITILSQEIEIADNELIKQLRADDTLAIFVRGRGKKAQIHQVIKVLEEFVEGASLVYLNGLVSTEQQSDGSFQIGGAQIKIGEAGADPKAYSLKKDMQITVIGRKFEREIYADRIASKSKKK